MLSIHHYTSIETLALILQSRKLRFNRLDRVDDLRESQKHSGIEFGKYFFVSCWTHSQQESIPQWQMYSGKMTGVRISLPPMPFQRKLLQPPHDWKCEMQGQLRAPLSLEEMHGPDYLVLPPWVMEPKHFAGSVEYVDDIEERYAAAVTVQVSEKGRADIQITRPFDLVRLKSTHWAFPAEYRFSLYVLPAPPLPPDGPGSPAYYTAMPSHLVSSLLTGVAPGIDHFDIDLSTDALAQLVVTTGPLCSGDRRAYAEHLVQKYAPEGHVQSSCLTGTIRDTSSAN